MGQRLSAAPLLIAATRYAIIKKIDGLGEALEQPRYNPTDGMMYLTGSGDNAY